MSEIPTIKEFAETFMSLHVSVHNKPSEQNSKRLILEKSLIPLLGEKRLDALRPLDIVTVTQRLKASGLTNKTINNRLTVLRKMLACAKDWELINAYPNIKPLKKAHTEVRFLTAEEVRALLEAMPDEPWHSMAVIALHCGLRVGELRALRWNDVDLGDRRLRIRQATWSWTKELVAPKSSKPRTVELSDTAWHTLRYYRRTGEIVFGALPKGDLLGYEACIVKMRRTAQAAGLKGVGWHTLRHTFASHLVMSGVPLATVQALMGHADITTTMKYAHLTPASLSREVSKLDGVFNR